MNAIATPRNSIRLTRRKLLGSAVAAAAGATMLGGSAAVKAAAARPGDLHHLVWAWQFSIDAAPNFIGARLRDNNLGLVLKTHDGTDWMAQYDKSPFAVSGPAQVQTLTRYYEDAGVPFHAWAVIKGTDLVREARMAADVLSGGVRSLFLDIEPFDGFWRGTGADALAFGRELRRLQPNAWVVLSVDPRPWIVQRLPLKEFTTFANEIAPQNYWRSFNTSANRDRYAQSGFPVPPAGVTPEFLGDVANALYSGFGLPVSPVGQGAGDIGEWQRFLNKSYSLGSKTVSVWRYGVAPVDVFSLLHDRPPPAPPPPPPSVLASPIGAGGVYTVQAGDTLSAISIRSGVPMDAIVQANNLADPGSINVGQKLTIPGPDGTSTVNVDQTVSTEAAPAAQSSDAGGQSYAVQSGDTLGSIASRFGRSVAAIAQANGIADPDLIAIGQLIQIP